VVARLFNLVQPDYAVFGEKDYQQLAVIRTMVRDLCWPIDIAAVATVRDAEGLALSSRNQYLSATERETAPFLHRVLEQVAVQVRTGSPHYGALENEAMKALEGAGFRPDYVCIRHAVTLQPVSEGDTLCVVLAAAWLGRTRLIDNVLV
jgi:pantoate--beta-alanine ligase